jgi:hypothetical protein
VAAERVRLALKAPQLSPKSTVLSEVSATTAHAFFLHDAIFDFVFLWRVSAGTSFEDQNTPNAASIAGELE